MSTVMPDGNEAATLTAQVDILNGTAQALLSAVDDPETPAELVPGLRLAATVIEQTAARVRAMLP